MGGGNVPRRKLGFAMCVALVVGNMIGSGVFLLPVDLAPLGWNSVYGWLITIGGTLCLVAAMARLAALLGDSCAPFSYPAAAFGPAAGFLIAWSYWISIWVTTATLAVAVVRNLSVLWPGLAAPAVGAGFAVGVIWLLTIINAFGVRTAGRLQVVTTLLKLLPLAAAILLGAWLIGSGDAGTARYDSVAIDPGSINTAATLTLFAMLGFESAMAVGDRVENAERVVPRATMWGTAITGLIYLLACSAVTLLLPPAAVHASSSPFALFFGTFVDPRLGALVAAFAAIAALGAINGYVLMQGEFLFALSRSGLLPAWFGSQNRFDVPIRASILSTLLASALVLVNFSRGLAGLFQFMLLVTTSVSILFYIAGALAGIRLARQGRIASSPGYLALAAAGVGYSIWAFYGAGIEASLWSLAMSATGVPIYLLMRRGRSTLPAAASPGAPPE